MSVVDGRAKYDLKRERNISSEGEETREFRAKTKKTKNFEAVSYERQLHSPL
jgi:hypothetical protein